jgi:hypothetical protein
MLPPSLLLLSQVSLVLCSNPTPISHLAILAFLGLVSPYSFESFMGLPGTHDTLLSNSPSSLTPRSSKSSCLFEDSNIACYLRNGIGTSCFRLITGLYHFTLSDFGSLAPRPMLKSYVTALIPRNWVIATG